jgi:hypothetical protein
VVQVLGKPEQTLNDKIKQILTNEALIHYHVDSDTSPDILAQARASSIITSGITEAAVLPPLELFSYML